MESAQEKHGAAPHWAADSCECNEPLIPQIQQSSGKCEAAFIKRAFQILNKDKYALRT
jgi:hypothetical protein